jgi:hypothetical protein
VTALIPFYSDGVLELAFWRNVALVDVAGDLTKPRMATLGSAYRALASTHPDGIVAFVMLRPGVPVSSPDARAEGNRSIKDLGEALLVLAVVVEDSGVFAQVMRTVIRGINLLTRTAKLVAFATVDDAVRATTRFVNKSQGTADPSDTLHAAVMAHRAAIDRASDPAMKHARSAPVA